MLVIISDLHLTDGTSTASLSAEAFQTLEQRLRELALAASWRSDGKYRPLERIDLVLLGDTLDLMRTNQWRTASVRPWSDPASGSLIEATDSIVSGILAENDAGLRILRDLAIDGRIELPPANHGGQPVTSAERVPLQVRIHYLVGDHDWQLHLPGEGYDAIRKQVCRALALATPSDQPFPHEPAESPELLHALRRHRVLARHGDTFCPLSCSEDRGLASVADVLAVELTGPFRYQLEQELEDVLPATALAGFGELDHIRPLPLAPVWLESYLVRSGIAASARAQIKRLWDDLVEDMLALEPIRRLQEDYGAAAVDGLAAALTYRRRETLRWSDRTSRWLNQLRGAETDTYACHALTEQDFRNRRARHVVYGHTHQAEIIGLDASCADGFVLNQHYFNAGTWRRSYQPTMWTGGPTEFVATEQLHLLAFYQGDERSGRTFETSSSVFAAQPLTAPRRRVDAVHSTPIPQQTPRVAFAAPHFRASAPGNVTT